MISLSVYEYVGKNSKNVLRLYLASAVPGHVDTSPSECQSVQDEEAGRGFHSASGLSVCC